jgi:hypothetical protein
LIEEPLAEAARRQGTTPELLAMDSLRKIFIPAEAIVADTSAPMSYSQMAQAFRALGKPIPDVDADLGADLDDYLRNRKARNQALDARTRTAGRSFHAGPISANHSRKSQDVAVFSAGGWA